MTSSELDDFDRLLELRRRLRVRFSASASVTSSRHHGGVGDVVVRWEMNVRHGVMLGEISRLLPCRPHADDRISDCEQRDMRHHATLDFFTCQFDIFDDGLPVRVTLNVEVGIVVLEIVLVHGFDAFELFRKLTPRGVDGLPVFTKLVDVLVVDASEDGGRR